VITGGVYAEDVGKFAHVLRFEAATECGFELGHPGGVETCHGEIVDIDAHHGKDPFFTGNVDAWVGFALVQTLGNESCTHELVKFPG
jgi:hypothetical protein